MVIVLCPSSAAIASRDMPRLMAWVARVCRSWWASTCPIPAAAAAAWTAVEHHRIEPEQRGAPGLRRPAVGGGDHRPELLRSGEVFVRGERFWCPAAR